jgi:hypothetical protein
MYGFRALSVKLRGLLFARPAFNCSTALYMVPLGVHFQFQLLQSQNLLFLHELFQYSK